MALINLLGTNTSGKSLAATAQERVNLYYEVLPQADKSAMVAYGWPGTRAAYVPIPAGEVRGIYNSIDGRNLYVAGSTSLYRYTAGDEFGPVPIAWPAVSFASGIPVWWQENLASAPPELLMMYNSTLVRLRLDTFVTNTVTMSAGGGRGLSFLAGRFISGISTGKFSWSDLNNGNSWPALNFATAESLSDGLVHQCVLRDNLVLFGTRSIEFWTASPDLNLPFTNVYTARNVGLLGANSVAIGDDCVYFVGIGATGGGRVYRLSGYDIQPISTPDIDRVLATTYPSELTSITGTFAWPGRYVYFGGRGFYVLNGRGLNDDTLGYSWAFDETNGVWSKIKSDGGSWQYNIVTQGQVYMAPGLTNVATVVSKTDSNCVYYISDEFLRESTGPELGDSGGSLTILRPQSDSGTWQEKTITCPHIFDGASLNNLVLSRVRLDMENPGISGNFRVGLSISRNGGKTYGPEMLQNLSTTGDGISRCEWRRLGIARDYVFKFRFPDAGKIAIIGAYVETHLANR